MAVRSHFEVLGVAPTASLDEIRAAYRQLARTHHPDSGLHPDAARMSAVNAAWHHLSDPGRRVVYEASLRGTAERPSPVEFDESDEFDEPDGDPTMGYAPRRWPAMSLMMLAILAIIFVFTAYAVRSGGPIDEPLTNPGPLTGGACVVIRTGQALGVPCTQSNYGVVATVVARQGRCPARSEGYFEPGSENLVCVTPR